MINKTANFWIRFLGRILDILLVFVLFGSLLFLIVNIKYKPKINIQFKNIYLFYIWFILLDLYLFFYFIIFPFFFNGQTLSMKILKIKIQFNEKNKFISLIKRELFFSLGWILMSLIVIIVINHTLIIKFAQLNSRKIWIYNFSIWENFRLIIFRIFAFFVTVIQFVLLISIVIRENNIGLHDVFSKTRTIWTKKFINIENNENEKRIKPKPIKNKPVEWIDGGNQ